MSNSVYKKLTEPLRRRVRIMLARAVGRLVDPTTLLQTMQIELVKGEVLDNIEHLEGYGRTAVPPEGFEALAASLAGDRSHTVVISAFHRDFRPKDLEPGDQAIYDDQGQVIALLRNKTIYIYGCETLKADVAASATITCPLVTVAASTKVVLDTPLTECAGDLNVAGEITDRSGTGGIKMSSMREIYDGHNHLENDLGGPTDPPNQLMG